MLTGASVCKCQKRAARFYPLEKFLKIYFGKAQLGVMDRVTFPPSDTKATLARRTGEPSNVTETEARSPEPLSGMEEAFSSTMPEKASPEEKVSSAWLPPAEMTAVDAPPFARV